MFRVLRGSSLILSIDLATFFIVQPRFFICCLMILSSGYTLAKSIEIKAQLRKLGKSEIITIALRAAPLIIE